MPKWSGYHVKSDGRAYFRPYIPNDLKAILGVYPMVNLGMKASRQAERLALMHFIAFEGVIEDKRREIAEEARKPRKRSLSDYTEVEVQAFAVETAQGLNREQHADNSASPSKISLRQKRKLRLLAASEGRSPNWPTWWPQ